MRKLMLLAAFAAGYVLGARAGRARYEQIKSAATKVRNDPRVQEKAPVVADKVTSAASTAASAVAGKVSGGSDDSPEPHHMAGPQGDLP
jgi:hypothetical protein